MKEEKGNDEIEYKYFYFNLEYGEHFKCLNDDEAGRVIKHICAYANGESLPELETPAEKIVANVITQGIDRAFKKYRAKVTNGRKGGAPKGNKNAAKQKPAEESGVTFWNLPFDDIAFEATWKLDDILHEINKYNIDGGYFNSKQLADVVASYALGECDGVDEFAICDTVTNEYYKNIKEMSLAMSAPSFCKKLKEAAFAFYEGSDFESRFADIKERAIKALELPPEQLKKYIKACSYIEDSSIYLDEDMLETFTESEFESLKDYAENNLNST